MTALLVVAGAGCHESPPASSAAARAAALPVAEVRVAEVRVEPWQGMEEVVGTVRARVRVVVEAKVAGRIEEVTVTPGSVVRKGDLLVRLDARELRARVDQAEAVLHQAGREFSRIEVLLKQEAVTRAEFDAVEARQRVARGLASEAQTMLGQAVILAPWDGVVTRKLAEAGDVAQPSRPLLELEDPRSLRFEADFPESLAARARVGDRFSVSVASSPRPILGTVDEIEPAADPVSRTFRVKLDLPGATNSSLRAGLFGRVSVPTGESSLLAIPTNALLVRGQMELVFSVEGGRAALRLVRSGKRWGNRVEVLSGLSPGERVVGQGAANLVDGQAVRELPVGE